MTPVITPKAPTHWFRRIVIFFVLALIATGAYTWLAMTWSYSSGERAGYVQKFSSKGWVCKTWEGELAMVTMPGTLAEKFSFTVRDEAVAKLINESMGHRVVVSYKQHMGIPTSCFGETGYFVSDVMKVVEDGAPTRAIPVEPQQKP
jgi:hypothetical protein